jgi:hypothetical protein
MQLNKKKPRREEVPVAKQRQRANALFTSATPARVSVGLVLVNPRNFNNTYTAAQPPAFRFEPNVDESSDFCYDLLTTPLAPSRFPGLRSQSPFSRSLK